ncbi:MAG TPA: M48 family metallopeptidase [Desulfosarcina sp.]|nr:M48 family metallopeptidase [Desulfosarcina sp.]
MKCALLILTLMIGLMLAGCEDTDIGMATQAGIEAVKAVTLDDADVQRLAAALSAEYDRNHNVAPPDNRYSRRLSRLVAPHSDYGGQTFDFKVYLSPKVNAFAMADGTIRIYSGLMDMMDDDELLFVVGHEMGHVIDDHIKNKIRLAYAGSAVRKAIASQRNEAGQIARGVLGALAQQLINAQYSQKEEREADDFGLTFIQRQGLGEQPAVSAMMKLASLGNDHSFLSSHPAPKARAERLQQNRSPSGNPEMPSLIDRIIAWLKALWPFGRG